MFEPQRLTLAYIRKRPESAARVLASMDAADSAAFLQQIPTRFAIPALACMSPHPASLLLRDVDTTSGAALLRDMEFSRACQVLRMIDDAGRRRLFADLPRRLKRDFENALAFPNGTVGAHMTTAIAALSGTDTVADAIRLIRKTENRTGDVVFIVDDRRRFSGVVPLAALLGAPAGMALADLLDTTCTQLSAYSRLDTVASLDAWHDFSRLPVVTRRGELAGALSRSALRRRGDGDAPWAATGGASLVDSMADALIVSIAGMFDLLVSGTGGLRGPGDGHGR